MSKGFSPKEIIQQIFSPMIGVVCSPQAEEICQKNNLTFVELLQPFSKLSTEANFRDPNGGTSSIKGIRLNVCDVGWRPPQTVLAKKMLNESVASLHCEKTRHIRINGKAPTNSLCFELIRKINVETTKLDIPSAQPWYEQWRETFFSVQFPADHEFTRHFLSCLIVLSSSDANPLESANNLTKKVQMMQNVTPQKLPKWLTFGTEILNSYVMLHDGCQGDITKAQQAFETLKLTFGDNKCFLLQINSYQGTTPGDCTDPWMKFLKKHPKSETHSDQNSAPKTPQDVTCVTAMPSSVSMSSLESPQANEELVDHPLSPVQEHASEAIHSNFSTSCDSLASQVVNPNVWANETDLDVPHGMWLTASDVDNLKHFIQDYTVRSLLPYVEKMVSLLNDTVTNKKGVSRSLLSATKRWFVTTKPAVNTTQNAVVYENDSIELQTRKLGDLYFMFGNYNLAFQAYHQAKRDFHADSAWQYYAGALEMAAMAAFMLGTCNRKTYDYMEEAILMYLESCKLPQFATRATMISVECLKAAKLFREAAKQLIRMTSEDSDLRSALLLEEASYAYLMSQPPLYRKYAFHIVLAGHRYTKCGQRKHAFRCYKQAYQVFENRGWSLAEDHIQYTIGKQAVTLKKLDEASNSLAHLLRPASLQSCNQQAAFLREYIATQKTLLSQSDTDLLLDIALPKIAHNMTRVLVTSHPPITTPNLMSATNIQINSNLEDEWKWQKLEEIVVQVASNKPVMLFKPTRSLFTSAVPTLENPICVHGEPIEISFVLENTIKPSITFEDINLLWTFTKENGEVETNAINGSLSPDHSIKSSYIKTIQMNEYDKKLVTLNLIPHLTGTLKITGIVGKISATNENSNLTGKLDFEPILIRPEGPSAYEKSPQYDKKLEISVLPPVSALHVSFSIIPDEVLAGEIIPIKVYLTNSGDDPLGSLYAATESPRWMLGDLDGQELPLSVLRDFTDLTNEALSRDKEFRKQHSFCLLSSVENGIALKAQETKTTTIWLQAPMKKGQTDIKLLIYYAMPNDYPKIKYRLVRHVWKINVNESLSVGASCSIGNMATGELGVDLSIKNLNQVHHALMTEFMLSNISLFNMQSPGLSRVLDEKAGLRSNERIDLRFSLNEYANKATTHPTDFIQDRLSQLTIPSNTDVSVAIPSLANIGSFLMKNETKYIGVLGQAGNNEEFNNIVSNEDPHLCVILTWKAIVHDNSSLQRIAFGQHFVQLRNLYETIVNEVAIKIKTWILSRVREKERTIQYDKY
ncbi:Trafficking protein particle complex subunit 8 [Pseudolycoriella hygida]|uniref:Trafficking protein particle complex subunit 8 n=1 Tax=Pseudolycoriella hygida TaxID=35572 RepID=A0A9Q0S123_9DIPT|nr:Trafficking protein particle complex subunit 8 [Pseudolycoriella hygida]